MPPDDRNSADPLAAIGGDDPAGRAAADMWARWLAAELVEDQDARLEQAGTTPDTGIALARIFIDVAASSGGSSSDEADDDEGLTGADLSSFAAVSSAPGLLSTLLSARPLAEDERVTPHEDASADTPANEVTRTSYLVRRIRHHRREESRRFLIIGGPGQGKSTLVQYLCQVHRSKLLHARASLLSARERQALDLVTERAQADRLPRAATACLPLRIILRDFAAWMFREKVDPADALIHFIANRVRRTAGAPVDPELVRAALSRVPWLLVLDGLDEVPSTAGRAEVLSAVRALVEGPLSRTPHIVVATTRPQGYGGEMGDFAVWALQGLSRERAFVYAARLVQARYPGQSTRQEEIFERLAWAWNEPASRRLMRTPLQVSIMAALVAQVGRAPADRWRLFSDYYRVMYQREAERPNLAQAELIRGLRRQIDETHRLAGLWLQTRSEQAGETDALLSGEELARLIDAVLERSGYEDADERRSLVEQIFDAAVVRLVFLTHAQEGKYGFEIRSLQELMAAEALLSGGDAEVTQRLRHIAPLDAWRNVFLFAAGKCFAETWHLAPAIVNEICPWLNDGHEDPAVRSALTGSEIALDLIEDGAVRNQPKLARSLVTLALRLLELPPAEVHARLASVGRIEFEALLRQGLEARLEWPEWGQRLSAWATLVAMADDDVLWAQEVANERWPSDGQARRDIVEAANKAGVAAGRWLQARMAEALGDFPPGFVRDTMFDTSPDMPLAWLAAACPDYQNADRECPLLVDGKPTGLEVSFTPHQDSDWDLAPFLYIENPPANWLPLVVAARFVEAPSGRALAEGLRALAEAHDTQTWSDLRWTLPWPLEQALAEAPDAASLRALVTRAEAGDCGEQEDWYAAESNWGQGVALESLIALESAWPHGEARERAFPFAAFWLGGSLGRAAGDQPADRAIRAGAILDQVLSAYRRAPSDRRGMLAHIVVRFLPHLARGRQVTIALGPREIEEIWGHVGDLPPPHVALALAVESTHLEAWADLVNRIGNETRSVPWHADAGFWKTAASLYSCTIDPAGLLRIIVFSMTFTFTVPDVPEPFRSIDPDRYPAKSSTRFFAALIRLIIERGDEGKCLSLLPALVDSVPANLLKLSTAARYIGKRFGRHPLAQPAVLAELLARLPGHTWRLGSIAAEGLRNYRKQRMSSLEDPDVWVRMGLPLPAPAKRVSSRPPPPLLHAQVDAVHIEGLRAFDTIDLPIPPPPENRTAGRWITLLGENGTGKTTILRSIALALADANLAATIVKASPAPYLAHDAETGLVRVEASGVAFSARFSRGAAATEELEGETARERPLLFAYGCRRGSALGGAARAVSFKPYEAIATLFEEGAGLIHAETWLKERALAAKEKDAAAAKVLFEAIRQALVKVLPGVRRIDVKAEGVWVEGPAIGRSMLEGLSDGYVSTMGWVLDLIARWIDHKERTKEPVGPDIFEEMEGIVLVDEIDLHLHPRWQVRVIDDIRSLFPRMTFVVTTHNPLTLLGARAGEVIVLRRSEIEVEGDDATAPASPRDRTRIEAFQQDIPPGLTVDQVLTGAWFGLASTLDKDTLKLLEQHRALLRERVERDDPKRLALEAELRKRLGGFADTSLERLAQSVAATLLPEQTADLGPARRERLRKRLLETVAAEVAPQPAGAETTGRSEERR